MGRKGGGWFAAVKKVFVSESKKDQKHHHQNQSRSKFACFGVHYEGDMENAPEGAPIAVVPSLPRRKETSPRNETENEPNKQDFSLALATAVAAGAAVAAAAEVSRQTNTPPSEVTKMNPEVAAIKIQTAYRGHLARRKLRGLRGLARLKTLVQGPSVQRQAATTLQCMQTLSRLQSQVRARKVRMSEENQALQRQQQQKREKEQANQIGEKWDDSSKSKEEVEAKLLQRQVAAMRREKALAYASTHQQTWKNSSKSATNATFMDPNNPHWGWNWLERWMAARPWEGQNNTYRNVHASSNKVTSATRTMSVGEITKLYTLRDQSFEFKNTTQSQIPTIRPRSSHNSPSSAIPKAPSSTGTKLSSSSSSKGGSWGGDGDSKSTFNKIPEKIRRHSIGVPPMGDNESQANSSPALSSHTSTPSTKVAKAKTSSTNKVKSASLGGQRNGTTEKTTSTPLKKRLSFPASPAARRHSVPTKPGNMVSNKNTATTPKEKVNVKNGGSR